ncbi:hypothetical protein [Hoyosella altamirensis]|uniref:Uncharacterized protein n=1 Tax=Hoyosella altamirensis TaxID=616997 RepID=A0A839RNM4_9ACTN|nr:hypothetical protein [Hoyosella altamirensis]MBB3037909.1 hypothetical protein [Hoyosella altamirensis]
MPSVSPNTLDITHRTGLAVIAISAVAVLLLMGPNEPQSTRIDSVTNARDTTSEFESSVDSALAAWRTNEVSADSAPKQQVVNGWVARDLLEVIAHQNNFLIEEVRDSRSDAAWHTRATVGMLQVRDERLPWLLVLLIAAIGWFGITAPRRS